MTELEMLTDARAYVENWASKHSKVSALDLETMQLDHLQDIKDYNHAMRSGLKRIFDKDLEKAFNEYLRNLPIRYRAEIVKMIACTEENLEPLTTWVKAVTGKADQDAIFVMAHWLWLVKRNAAEKPVVHHIMPIITSHKQGSGKSTAVQKLIAPLHKVSLELSVPQVVDERSFTLFNSYLIGFCDEMAGAGKVEIESFKRNVTSSTLSYRPMRTNTQMKIDNYCAFIGASNNSIFEIIKDTTGTRRFFSIRAQDNIDRDVINNLDYEKLWQGIDENLDRGYYERVQDSVGKQQEELSMKDEIISFLEDFNVLPEEEKQTHIVNGKLLYQEYLIHAANSGIKFTVTAQTFYKKLRDMGISAEKNRDNKRVMTWFFAVNIDHALSLGGRHDS